MTTNIRAWLDARLAEFRQAMKWTSIQLNAAASVLTAVVLASPDALAAALRSLPAETREWFPPVAGMVLFAVIYVTRVYKSKDLNDD